MISLIIKRGTSRNMLSNKSRNIIPYGAVGITLSLTLIHKRSKITTLIPRCYLYEKSEHRISPKTSVLKREFHCFLWLDVVCQLYVWGNFGTRKTNETKKQNHAGAVLKKKKEIKKKKKKEIVA